MLQRWHHSEDGNGKRQRRAVGSDNFCFDTSDLGLAECVSPVDFICANCRGNDDPSCLCFLHKRLMIVKGDHMDNQNHFRRVEKLNPRRVQLRIGESVKGKFLKFQESTDFHTGVVTTNLRFAIHHPSPAIPNEVVLIVMNSGLSQALGDAGVKEGQSIEIVRMQDVPTKNGGVFSQYEIYALEVEK